MSTHSSPVKARRRADVWFALAAVTCVAALAWVVITMQSLSQDLRTANDARDALASQVERLGGKPVAGPPGSRGESITGPRGPKGERGEPGNAAPTITPKPGASGAPGRAGKDGEDGKDGADSIVPGPSGPPGQDATGAPGQDGKDGADGRDGSDGRPPAGWTFEYGGATYTCEPVDDFSTDAPRYKCESTEPEPQKKNSDPKPLSMALDPNRKRW